MTKPVDRESAYEKLAEVAPRGTTKQRRCRREGAAKTSGGGSRSDSFWTTLGKTVVRTGVPLATKVLTDAASRAEKVKVGGLSLAVTLRKASEDPRPIAAEV